MPGRVGVCILTGNTIALRTGLSCLCGSLSLGGDCLALLKRSPTCRLGICGFKSHAVQHSSISVDSSPKHLQKKQKKPVLSTNVIHVGEESVFDKKATVKLLKSSQLHKVEKLPPVSTKLPNSNDSEALKEDFLNLYKNNIDVSESSGEFVEEESFFPIPEEEVNTKIKKIKKGNSKIESDLKLYREARWKGRNQNFNETLVAFICVCMNSRNAGSAFQTFNHYLMVGYKAKTNSKMKRTLNLNAFNEILKGIATEGGYKRMTEVKKHLVQCSLTPDRNTFAHILSCLGRCRDTDFINGEIKSTLQWIEKTNINLEDLFTKASFCGKSNQYFLKAVERVIPDLRERFEIFHPTKELLQRTNCYKNPLVDSLNDSLFTTKNSSPAEGVLTQPEMDQLIEKQINREVRGFIEVPSIWNNKTPECISSRELLEEWKVHWAKSIRSTLRTRIEFLAKEFKRRDHRALDFYPYFEAVHEDDVVNLMMTEVHKLCMGSNSYSPTLNNLALYLGDQFYNCFLIKYSQRTGLLDAKRDVYERYCQWYLDRFDSSASYVPRVQWNKLNLESIEKNNLEDRPPDWPYPVRTGLGRILYSIIVSAVTIWEPGQTVKNALPAFYKVHRTYDLKVRDEIKPSPIVTEVRMKATSEVLHFQTGSLPMVSPPVPWTSIHSGGYIVSGADFVRVVQHAHQQKNEMKKRGTQQLFPVMDSLNQLGSIPWKINEDMLDLLIKVFQNKGWEKMDVPPPMSELAPPLSDGDDPNCPSEKGNLRRKLLQHYKKKKEMYSLWCSMLYKLSIANYFRHDTIWLPLNMDFRGRTYPIPPHLTHLSSDVFRSLMLFAQGKELGHEGLSWLKLHLINLTGMKKRSNIKDRLAFCEEMMDEIFDSADAPLTGRKWWTESDEPWQTLAACKELVAALRSGCPEDYVSRLPIHQDGSCNGLQHYAALGRDKMGAHSVNLSPSDVPQDVYSDVVTLVEEARRKDDEELSLPIARVLNGVVKRKLIKQTIMTTVYGVTKFGANLQIRKQLNYLDDFPEKDQFSASLYLANKTFESMGTIFSATQEIQYWLVRIAEGIAKNCVQNVEWATPLGFPVVQPYGKNISSNIVPGAKVYSFNSDFFLKPNTRKQKNAFPPNFIHSLDSSHMMLTSLFCQHADITFVSIHDCFWTHASTVPIMNKICRQQFVALHSYPVFEEMTKFMREKYSSHVYYSSAFAIVGKDKRLVSVEDLLSSVPEKGDFDIKEVLNSVFFFS